MDGSVTRRTVWLMGGGAGGGVHIRRRTEVLEMLGNLLTG